MYIPDGVVLHTETAGDWARFCFFRYSKFSLLAASVKNLVQRLYVHIIRYLLISKHELIFIYLTLKHSSKECTKAVVTLAFLVLLDQNLLNTSLVRL